MNFEHQLKVISFSWEEVNVKSSFQIGFFETGEQLACCFQSDESLFETFDASISMKEQFETFKEGINVDCLQKFHPTIEFLICLLNKIKETNIQLNNFQLETILLLFQQLRINDLNDMKRVKAIIDSWIEIYAEIDYIFSNMKYDRLENQSLAHAFFSLAFSNLPSITSTLQTPLVAYWEFHTNQKFFNTLLAAIFGGAWARQVLSICLCEIGYNFGNDDIMRLVDELGIKQFAEPASKIGSFPQVLLHCFPGTYYKDMDPRSTLFLPPREFLKCTFQKSDFTMFLFGEEYYTSYLVYKCIHDKTKREEILKELKQTKPSSYFYTRYTVNIGPNCENAFMSIINGLEYLYPVFENQCEDKEMVHLMKKRRHHLLEK